MMKDDHSVKALDIVNVYLQSIRDEDDSCWRKSVKNSIFENIPVDLPDEIIETIGSSKSVKIERIVSKGHVSPKGFWYDQTTNEFVLLVRGSARLRIEGKTESIELQSGDYMDIKAHVKHRVEWTDPVQATVWLAIHY